MTIIKKRGRIVRNIFVIDRYDATSARHGLLGRNAFTYSADPNAAFAEPYVGYPAIIFRSENSKQRPTTVRDCRSKYFEAREIERERESVCV